MNEHTNMVITRFPPSPTGHFHVGSARTALFNYIFAKKHGGSMVLRFEDTDKERSEVQYEKEIQDSLDWLNIEYEASFRQSERTDVYKSYLKKMIEEGSAYVSEEKEGERESVIRFKNPNTTISFNDLIRGEIEVDTTDLGDFVIAKSMDEPLYHLAVVIDDFESNITHVIRGEDGISNTPRQILLQEAIGAPRPFYAHIPFILGPDKSKLSKRHGPTSLLEYRDEGYMPEAMINYLALLGWHPKDEREILTLDEIIDLFEIEDVQKAGAVFSTEKLKWVNKHYIRGLSDEALKQIVKEWVHDDIKNLPHFDDVHIDAMLPVIRERIETFADIKKMGDEGELEFYFEDPDYFAPSLLWKDEESFEVTKKHLAWVKDALNEIDKNDFNEKNIQEHIWEYASNEGRGAVLWPMRYALSGVDRSPSPFELAEILGKNTTLARLQKAIEKIEKHTGT